ncbi:MAG: hypothetical protein JWP97_5381 [Labilithrix sp.]|nr:hypothetical protein [Labilithrix sp.]
MPDQLGNVGNIGDILKHAALVELAAWLTRERTDVSFVDTHTFQLEAPLPDRARWEREVDALSPVGIPRTRDMRRSNARRF